LKFSITRVYETQAVIEAGGVGIYIEVGGSSKAFAWWNGYLTLILIHKKDAPVSILRLRDLLCRCTALGYEGFNSRKQAKSMRIYDQGNAYEMRLGWINILNKFKKIISLEIYTFYKMYLNSIRAFIYFCSLLKDENEQLIELSKFVLSRRYLTLLYYYCCRRASCSQSFNIHCFHKWHQRIRHGKVILIAFLQ
jgi:hypothetical protein